MASAEKFERVKSAAVSDVCLTIRTPQVNPGAALGVNETFEDTVRP
jgi:hypothetical protein